MTLKEFWNNANGVYDFINKNGETIDDMVYPVGNNRVNTNFICKGDYYYDTSKSKQDSQ